MKNQFFIIPEPISELGAFPLQRGGQTMDFKVSDEIRSKDGFTLVELLIVVAIIGILATMAIPQFSSYRQKAYDAGAKSDLANLAQMQDYYFVNASTYTSDTADLTEWQASSNVTVTITAADLTNWTATARHANGTQTFTWDSAAGGLQ